MKFNCNKSEIYRDIHSLTARWTKTTINQRSVGIRDGNNGKQKREKLFQIHLFWRIKLITQQLMNTANRRSGINKIGRASCRERV